MDSLKNVLDPELGFSIVDLGLIYDVQIDGGMVNVSMTLTTPFCPVAGTFVHDVEEKIKTIPDVQGAKVKLTFEPPWTPERLSEEKRMELGL